VSAIYEVGQRVFSAVDPPLSGAGLQPGPAHHLLLHLQVKVSRDDGFVAVLHIVLWHDALIGHPLLVKEVGGDRLL